jgi:hypothetical protein
MRHRRTIIIAFIVFFVLLFSARTIISYYVDSLWFASLSYSGVFWKTLSYEWSAFALSFVATFIILYAWFSALRHGCREELASAGTVRFGNQSYELPLDPVLRVAGPASRSIGWPRSILPKPPTRFWASPSTSISSLCPLCNSSSDGSCCSRSSVAPLPVSSS